MEQDKKNDELGAQAQKLFDETAYRPSDATVKSSARFAAQVPSMKPGLWAGLPQVFPWAFAGSALLAVGVLLLWQGPAGPTKDSRSEVAGKQALGTGASPNLDNLLAAWAEEDDSEDMMWVLDLLGSDAGLGLALFSEPSDEADSALWDELYEDL